ncbi:MAG TPA: ABC transporter permease subunit [Candidatus Binatia bacterium]|nr:ABC transporter permease subunit [Candidatus Binatia bacterium]
MRRTWGLYKKEVRSYFVTPLFYVVATVFLCLCGWFFYSDLNFFTQFGFGMDILSNFFQLLFVDIATKAMTFTVPLLTMRLFAEERKLGTIELLFTYPMRDGEVVAGKFLAAATVFVIMLAATLTFPVYLYTIQPYPFGTTVAGYTGLVLLGLVFIAIGIFVSSLTDSQVVAGVFSLFLVGILWLMSWNEAAGGDQIMNFVKAFSTFDHFWNFSKGVVDSSDLLYYVFVAAFFIVLTLRSLESRRWRGRA